MSGNALQYNNQPFFSVLITLSRDAGIADQVLSLDFISTRDWERGMTRMSPAVFGLIKKRLKEAAN